MKNRLRILLMFITLFTLINITSCISLKDLEILQHDNTLKLNDKGMIDYNVPAYHIQIDDRISINVSSANNISMGILSDFITGGNQDVDHGNAVTVKSDGNIELPRIGKIYLEGLTIEQARKKIQNEFYKIYSPEGTFIDVNLSGISYSILGELSPGTYLSHKNKISILEAFAKAGNSNIYADLRKIRIIRSSTEGTKQVYVDITSEGFMNSEYFWIQNNDIIIVNPRKEKVWGIGLNPLSVVTTIMGATTTLLGVYLLFRR